MKINMLYPKPMIRRAIYSLAESLSQDFKDLHVVIVGKGGLFFGTDLIRYMGDSVTGISYVSCQSYLASERTDEIDVVGTLTEDTSSKTVLIVDDICDTGLTLAALHSTIAQDSKEVITATLVSNKARRRVDYDPTFSCFELNKDIFLVGYGMDLDNRYRTLESIYYV